MKIAVKEIDFTDEAAAAQVQCEIELQKGLYHPHIVRYLGSEVGMNTILVFMEQVPHGVSLIDLVQAWEPLSNHPRLFREYSYQVLRGLAYVVHALASLGSSPRMVVYHTSHNSSVATRHV